jgi:hypothetical protein
MSEKKKAKSSTAGRFFKRLAVKIILTAALIAALAAAAYFGWKKLTAVKAERLRTMVTRELNYCAELSVTKTSYSEIVSIKKTAIAGMARSYSIVRYGAVIRMGFEDITQSAVYVSPDSKSAYVDLPALIVLGNDITNFEVFDEARSIFVSIQTQEIFDEIKKSQNEVLARILETGLQKESEEHAKSLITRILSAMGFENISVSIKGASPF